ncbi:MAG: hypothetical protein LCH52_15010 [Bacteroidetes bacterium]|nr:hypothetical protein [Bacteroidota bacterium]
MMRYSITSGDENQEFRLLSTPLFCGINPLTPDESIFPVEIDASLFPKNSQRLFELAGAKEYTDILNIHYVSLLRDRRVRKVTIDQTRHLIAELFYGEPGRFLKEIDKRSALKLKETFPEKIFLDGHEMEITPVLREILDHPAKRYLLKFSTKNKKYISSNLWIKKVYHIHNLLAFYPDEYLKSVTVPKESLTDMIRSFMSIISSQTTDVYSAKTSHKDVIAEAALILQALHDIQDERTKDFIHLRFGQGLDMKVIGKKHGISSERVRQKLVAFIDDARHDISPLERKLQAHILNQLVRQPEVLQPDFFHNDIMEVDTFVRMLNTIYPSIPSYCNKFFVSQNIYREENPLYGHYLRLREYFKEKDGVTMEQFMEDFSDVKGWEKLNIFRILLAIKYFKIIRKNNTCILRGRLSLPEMAEHTLQGRDEAMKIKDLIALIKDLYGREYHDLKVSLCHIRMNPSVLQLDRDTFGVEKHLSYQGDESLAIQKLVADFLEEQKKIVDASVLFKLAKKQFPRIRSKYELVQILRRGKDIVDLGFFCFIHSSVKMDQRKIVNEYLVEVLSKNNFVMHGKELLAEINKKRVVSVTGFSSKLQHVDFIDSYGGNFYGLKDHREENKKTIAKDPLFISNFLFQSAYPDMRLSKVPDLFKEFDVETITNTILTSDLFILFDHPDLQDKLILSKSWKRNKLFYIILYAQKRAITLDELNNYMQPLGYDSAVLPKINFYALGIEVAKEYCWIRGKTPVPKDLPRRRRTRKKKA